MIKGVQATKLRVLLISGFLGIVSVKAVSAQSAPQTSKASEFDKTQLVESYGKRPLSFRANMGQMSQSLNSISPSYAKVHYGAVSRDADLLYYGNERQLEFEVPVAPDADQKKIRLQFSEVTRLKLDAPGVVSANDGDFAFRKEIAYREKDSRRDLLAGRFVLGKRHRANFSLSGNAPPNPLVIDPAVSYSPFLSSGGSNGDTALAISLD